MNGSGVAGKKTLRTPHATTTAFTSAHRTLRRRGGVGIAMRAEWTDGTSRGAPRRRGVMTTDRSETGSFLFSAAERKIVVVKFFVDRVRARRATLDARRRRRCRRDTTVMLELALGVALWAAPPPIKFPGLAVVGAAKAAISARRRARGRSGGASNDSSSSSARGPRSRDVALRWDSLTMTISPKKRKKKGTKDIEGLIVSPKKILDRVSGAASPGRLMAIMGPSGSGKTSLLNALALQTPASDRVRLSGSLAVNGLDVGREGSSDAEHAVAYVQQEDVFYSQLTVYETLETAARLRMGAGATRETRELAITALLRRLGLTHARDTRVGDKKTRGISGGEKKRLALACELVGESPAVVAADEPTSGLDAFQAQRVMESLRALARDERKTVICSIHQPRGARVLYSSPTRRPTRESPLSYTPFVSRRSSRARIFLFF